MSGDTDPDLRCGRCGFDHFTAPIAVILVFAPGMNKPYPLIPAEDYRICVRCDAIFTMIDKAVEAHPTTREAGPWARAIIVYSDGRGTDVTPKRTTAPMAMA